MLGGGGALNGGVEYLWRCTGGKAGDWRLGNPLEECWLAEARRVLEESREENTEGRNKEK